VLTPPPEGKTPPFGPTAWKHPGAFSPRNFDPRRFDPTTFLPVALARARSHYSDAALARIDAEGVFPDGHIDLTLSDDMYTQYLFFSPSRAKRPDDLPIGMKHEPDCRYVVRIGQDMGIVGYAVDHWACEEPTLPLPRCSAAAIWKKAIAKGAPGKNAVAQIGYWADDKGKGRWLLDIDDVFSEWIPDDCR
jgi:hypothetical protein